MVTSIESIQRSYGLLAPQLLVRELAQWYVRCSVTGELIPLTRLKYWNVDRKECYRDAEVALGVHEALRS